MTVHRTLLLRQILLLALILIVYPLIFGASLPVIAMSLAGMLLGLLWGLRNGSVTKRGILW